MFIKEQLKVSERDDLKLTKTCKGSKCNFESVWLDVMKNKEYTCIMTGAINVNLLNIDGTITTDYISSVMSHGFVPCITRPKRIPEYTATLIDHIFIRPLHCKIGAPVIAVVLFNDKTDHLPIFIFISNPDKMQCSQWPKVRIFSDTKIQKFTDKICSIIRHHVLNHESGNKNWSEFYNQIKKFYPGSFPLVRVSRKRDKDKSWITWLFSVKFPERSWH